MGLANNDERRNSICLWGLLGCFHDGSVDATGNGGLDHVGFGTSVLGEFKQVVMVEGIARWSSWRLSS